MDMQGNTILVTGGSSGIGLALAELLHRLGNEVLVPDGPPAPGLRCVDLDLSDPWSVAGFSERMAANCPGLNMLVNVAVCFPARQLPGMRALLHDDRTAETLEARRLGLQHLTGALLPHWRKRAHGSVMNICVSSAWGPPQGRPAALQATQAGTHAFAMTVSRRQVSACIDVMDVARGAAAGRMPSAAAARGLPRAQFIACVARLLAEGLHEAVLAERLRALWPAPRPVARPGRDLEPVPLPAY